MTLGFHMGCFVREGKIINHAKHTGPGGCGDMLHQDFFFKFKPSEAASGAAEGYRLDVACQN